jgi:hypothetical protein
MNARRRDEAKVGTLASNLTLAADYSVAEYMLCPDVAFPTAADAF